MAAWNSELRVARQITEAGNTSILASTTQSSQLALGSDEVEDDAGKTEPGIEMAEAIDEGRHAISHRLGTDQQHHRYVKYLSDLCSTATRTIGTVEEPHGSLDDTSIGIAAIMPEQGLHMGWGRHIGVEVHRLYAGCHLVEKRIDIVGTALERLYRESPVTQSAQESKRESGLATARGGSGNHETMRHNER
jgi:hypothetical protein